MGVWRVGGGGDWVFPSPGPEGLEKWEMGKVGEELGGDLEWGGMLTGWGAPVTLVRWEP